MRFPTYLTITGIGSASAMEDALPDSASTRLWLDLEGRSVSFVARLVTFFPNYDSFTKEKCMNVSALVRPKYPK